MTTDSRGRVSNWIVVAALLARVSALTQQGTAILQGTAVDESTAALPGVALDSKHYCETA